MEFKQAIELAGRYHFSLLTLLMKDGLNAVVTDKQKTFRLYEKMCDTITNDELSTDKLVFLQKLPSVSKWSQDEAYLIMSDALNPFSDLKPFNSKETFTTQEDVTIEELENAYLSKFNASDIDKVKNHLVELKKLYAIKKSTNGYREFLTK